jgi:hypothetical protein
VYVQSAPDEPAIRENKVTHVLGGDKHVNIIFVKTPIQDSSSKLFFQSRTSRELGVRPPEEG